MQKAALPKGVIAKHGALYWISTDPETKKQTWHRLGKNWTEAAPKWRSLVIKTRKPAYVARVVYGHTQGGPIPREFLRTLLRSARKNASPRGLECTITLEDLEALAEQTGDRCSLTRIRFEYGEASEAKDQATRRKRLWAPSIDRIDSAQGYTPGNIRFVCFAVNAARQEFTDEVLIKIGFALSNIQ